MSQIAIPTAQNIVIEQTVASVGERIVASIIDYAFIGIYAIILLFTGIQGSSPLTYGLLVIPVFVFYHLLSELLMEGQSWGKKIMKIKVVKIDGSHEDFISLFIRWAFRIVDIWIFFGAIASAIVVVNGKGQRLGDIAANTTVIRVKELVNQDSILIQLPENHEVTFRQAAMLKDSDIYTIKEILNYVDESYCSEESIELASKAKNAIEKKLGIASDLKAERFLRTMLLDYNYLHTR